MQEHHSTNTSFYIETKDRAGNWHPWVDKLNSRQQAEEYLAADLEKMAFFFVEAKIVQKDTKTSTSLLPIKNIEIK
jgi:hypothetical protein